MLHLDPTVVFIGLCTTVLAIVGFVIARQVKAVDDSLTKVSAKIAAVEKNLIDRAEGLAAQDTQILIQLADLRARVVTCEVLVGLKQIQIPEKPR